MTADAESDAPVACLVSGLARLMTHYALNPNGANAEAVVRVLHALQAHPEIREQPVLENTYGRMLPHWQTLAMSRQRSVAAAAAGDSQVH